MLNIDKPTLQQVSDVLSVPCQHGAVAFSGVSIDSRTLKQNDLFVVIKGDNFDGHDFIKKAKEAGAAAAIVEKKSDIDLPQLVVENSQESLIELAKAWRQQVNIPIIGITGSNGKTTVKEMVAAILSQTGEGLKTAGNFNNEIGVPLTLLKLRTTQKWAVIEMGASHPDEIAALVRISQPTIALVNNVAKAHVEGFGSLDEIANTKGAIFENLPAKGFAVMPVESGYTDLWCDKNTAKNRITFGEKIAADVSVDLLHSECYLSTPVGDIEVNLHLLGKHNRLNAAAATAITLSAGANLSDIKAGLESLGSVSGRLQKFKHQSGAEIINDTYNANPASANVALDYLSDCEGKTIFVLGDMGELGEEEKQAHQALGQRATKLNISMVMTLGNLSQLTSEAFSGSKQHFVTQDELVDQLQNECIEGVTILIKGSRFMHMDKIVSRLMESEK